MRSLPQWAVALCILLVVAAIITWYVRQVEPRFAFFPIAGEQITPQALGIPFTPHTIATDDGERLRVWHMERADARAHVVYFHGNGGNLSLWTDVLAAVYQQGFDVIAVDYRGYGISTGTPTEQGLYRDVDATLRFADTALGGRGTPVLYWGRSLGTVMAAYAASRGHPSGVILESGFPTMRSVLETNPVLWLISWASTYRMPTAEWMASVTRPTLVLHGDNDSVIRYSLGQRLFEAIPGPKTFVTLPGGEHNGIVPPDAAAYWQAIHAFVDSLTDTTSSSARR